MHTPGDWWRTFFTGGMVESWLRATTDEQTRQEANFIQEMLQVAAPARLLDVPCGGGRLALDLAGRGYRLTGVDISADFLAAARAAAAGRDVPVHWEQRDMRDLPWPEAFDGAFCFGNSFGYLDDAGNADFLKAVKRCLKPGARLVLDTSYLVEGVLPNLQEKGWYPIGDALLLADRLYDPVQGRLRVEYIWVREGRAERFAMSARLFTFREVIQLVEAAGFKDIQAFDSLTREPFRFGSRRLLVAATS